MLQGLSCLELPIWCFVGFPRALKMCTPTCSVAMLVLKTIMLLWRSTKEANKYHLSDQIYLLSMQRKTPTLEKNKRGYNRWVTYELPSELKIMPATIPATIMVWLASSYERHTIEHGKLPTTNNH